MKPSSNENAKQENSLDLPLTEEQKAIIVSKGNIKINAVAGSGKTTTIIHYAAHLPKTAKILYLAFNKSVKLEAKRKFIEQGMHNVQVETAHSLAYKYIVANSDYKICQNDYKTYEIAELLGLKGTGEKLGEYILANHIYKFITYFCNSQAEKVQDLNYLDIISDIKAKSFVSKFYRHIEQGARLLLNKMNRGEIEIIHDFYLKLFQLSRPHLHFDYILFDEGQDASPAMLDIFLRQKATKVIVGDTHQQIYSWRHAVNSLAKVDFTNYYLSTSFRFPDDIAKLSMETLAWKRFLKEFQPVKIVGKGQPPKTNSKATIARTNLGLLLKAINYITEHRTVKYLYFEGNLNSYTYADEGASLYDVLHLYNGKTHSIRDKLIRSMANLHELEEYVEKTEDIQLSMMVDIVKEYGNEIPGLIRLLKSKHVSDQDKAMAEMIFSTVHRAKGMEYDEVHLADDFINESKLERLQSDNKSDEEINIAQFNEEINLLYVAITRTKEILHIPEILLPKNFPALPHIQIIKARSEEDDLRITGQVRLVRSSRKAFLNKYNKNLSDSFSYTDKRFMHKSDYWRWTAETEAELKEMYYKGIELNSIAKHFHRKKETIVSRLVKLGCLKYEE